MDKDTHDIALETGVVTYDNTTYLVAEVADAQTRLSLARLIRGFIEHGKLGRPMTMLLKEVEYVLLNDVQHEISKGAVGKEAA